MLKVMNELDDVWAQMISDAATKAQAAGRGDVAEYLLLKSTNDMIRAASVNWLLESAAAIAAEANLQNARIEIENQSPHNFAFGNSNLVGALVRFRQGVRCLSVEAGWTRTPGDGFMRGGALACARISHFGIGRENQELLLIRGDNAPNWFALDKENKRALFDSRNLQRHFQIFLDAV
jgi:hypothetical protein